MGTLDGLRVLIVGASRGVGAAMATACGAAGAHVAVAARTTELLQMHANAYGATAVQCDVCDEASCRAAVDAAVEALGGLDALVYSTGVTSYGRVAAYDRRTVEEVFATNVFGAHSILAAAVPHLEATGGRAVVLNSESAQWEPDPWPGISVYIASKRALDSIVRSFQIEHPAIAFTSYFVGSTLTSIPSQGVEPFFETWLARGYLEVTNALMPQDHGEVIVNLLSVPARIRVDRIGVRPRHIPGGVVEM